MKRLVERYYEFLSRTKDGHIRSFSLAMIACLWVVGLLQVEHGMDLYESTVHMFTAMSTGGSGAPIGTEITGARGCPPDASAARRTASSGSMPTVERPSVRRTMPPRTRLI